MQTVALVVLLLLAFSLIGVVLLQRNEGGGLGMGTAGVMSGRGQATALQRATWWLGGAFMVTSLVLTILAAQEAGDSSVVDQIRSGGAPDAGTEALPEDGLLGGGSLLPPPEGAGDAADGAIGDPLDDAVGAPLVPAGD
jgi:preprotein translocase subunit SecG